MRVYSLSLLLVFLVPFSASAESSVNRRDGFLQIWNSISRPAEFTKRDFFDDVASTDPGHRELTYALVRGILDDEDFFRPTESLTVADALVWMLRTRNVSMPDDVTRESLPKWLERYPLSVEHGDFSADISLEKLSSLLRQFDELLAQEVHVVSNYGEYHRGMGTAFGEKFNPDLMTAAHRTFPHNTMVEVTNVENGQSIVVRINDRGPYIEGRDMDLSTTAFSSISGGKTGTMKVRFRRLGDSTLIGTTSGACRLTDRRKVRVMKGIVLNPGVPHELPLGETLTIGANKDFVVRGVRHPDGTKTALQDFVAPGETYSFQPSQEGNYAILLGSPEGRTRAMTMKVSACTVPGQGS